MATPIDPNLSAAAVDYRLARRQADREMALKALGGLSDVDRGASVADATRAYAPSWEGQGLDPEARLEARQKLLDQLAELDRTERTASVEDRKTDAQMAKDKNDLFEAILKSKTDVDIAAIRSKGEVAVAKVRAFDNARSDAQEVLTDVYGQTDITTKQSKLKQLIQAYRPAMGTITPDGKITWDADASANAQTLFFDQLNGLLDEMTPGQQAHALAFIDGNLGLPVGRGFADVGSTSGRAPLVPDKDGNLSNTPPGFSTTALGNLLPAYAAPAFAPSADQFGTKVERALAEADTLDKKAELSYAEVAKAKADLDHQGIRDPGIDAQMDAVGIFKTVMDGAPLTPEQVEAARRAGVQPDLVERLAGGERGYSVSSGVSGARPGTGYAEGEPIDPNSARGRTLALLDELEQPNPGPPTLVKKLGIMNSPQFQDYMDEQGITDPNVAFRALMQRTRQQQRLVRREDRQALAGSGPGSAGRGAAAGVAPAATAVPAAGANLAASPGLALTRGSATATPPELPPAPPSTLAGVDAARRAAISHVLIGANETAQARSLADQPTGFAETLRGLPVGREPRSWEDDPANKRAKQIWAQRRLGGN